MDRRFATNRRFKREFRNIEMENRCRKKPRVPSLQLATGIENRWPSIHFLVYIHPYGCQACQLGRTKQIPKRPLHLILKHFNQIKILDKIRLHTLSASKCLGR